MAFAREFGLLTCWGPAAMLFRHLDDLFRSWATELGAVEYLFPPVLSIDALDRADYFKSFPHFSTAVSPLRDVAAARDLGERSRSEPIDAIEAELLAKARHLLAPAACYAVYNHFHGKTLEDDVIVTTIAPCFRTEEAYEPCSRQWAFWLREIVCMGRLEFVRAFLDDFRDRLAIVLGSAGFPFTIDVATDAFFDRRDPRILVQQLEPVKYEVRYRGSLAITSLNFHRNFFGERFGIRDATGSVAFTGCVGFGLERWMTSLIQEYGVDLTEYPSILRVVDPL